jgi:hypothetical protein
VLTVNVAVVDVGGTDTEDGAVRIALLLVRVTVVPLMEAALVTVTVQVDWADGPRLVGEHERALTTVGALGAPTGPPVTVPPVVETAIESPAKEAATPFDNPTTVLKTPPAIVRFTTAATPLLTTVELRPYRMHVRVPVPLLQTKD